MRMNPARNGSTALQRFERSNVIAIRNRIMFEFYPGLPHLLFSYLIFCHEALAVNPIAHAGPGTITISALETGNFNSGAGGAQVLLLLL